MDFSRDFEVRLEPHIAEPEEESVLGSDLVEFDQYQLFVHSDLFVKNNGKTMVGYVTKDKKGRDRFQPTPEFNRPDVTDDLRKWIDDQVFEKLAEIP